MCGRGKRQCAMWEGIKLNFKKREGKNKKKSCRLLSLGVSPSVMFFITSLISHRIVAPMFANRLCITFSGFAVVGL